MTKLMPTGVKQVKITADAYFVCLLHALSNEKEEIMGLLLGEIDENRVSHISEVRILQRSDKQPDRVEIPPEQLFEVTTEAEDLSKKLGRPLRVIGWYHSHPHITVWPSHVDVRTQQAYQQLDPGFVGLIFSVFNHDKKSKNNRMEVVCFQSKQDSAGSWAREEVALSVSPCWSLSDFCVANLERLPNILGREELEAFSAASPQDVVTALHNKAVFGLSACHQMETLTGPLLQLLQERLVSADDTLADIKRQKQRLQEELASLD